MSPEVDMMKLYEELQAQGDSSTAPPTAAGTLAVPLALVPPPDMVQAAAPSPNAVAGAIRWHEQALAGGWKLSPHYVAILRAAGHPIDPAVLPVEAAPQTPPQPAAAPPFAAPPETERAAEPEPVAAAPDVAATKQAFTLHASLLGTPELANLYDSGLTDETIAENGLRFEKDPEVIQQAMNRASPQEARKWVKKKRVDPKGDLCRLLNAPALGLWIPCYLPGQTEPYCVRMRPRFPRAKEIWEENANGRHELRGHEQNSKGEYEFSKYENPREASPPIYLPRATIRVLERWAANGCTERLTILFTEGEKKALLLAQIAPLLGLGEYVIVVGLTGIDNGHDAAHRDEHKGQENEYRFRQEIRDHIPMRGARVFIVFDSHAEKDEKYRLNPYDAKSNPDGAHPSREPVAAQVIANMALEAGAKEVRFCTPPTAAVLAETSKGIDDLFKDRGKGDEGTAAVCDVLKGGKRLVFVPWSALRARRDDRWRPTGGDAEPICTEEEDERAKARAAEREREEAREAEAKREAERAEVAAARRHAPQPSAADDAADDDAAPLRTAVTAETDAHGRRVLLHNPANVGLTAHRIVAELAHRRVTDILVAADGTLVEVASSGRVEDARAPYAIARALKPAAIGTVATRHVLLRECKYWANSERVVEIGVPRDVCYRISEIAAGEEYGLRRHTFVAEVPLWAADGRILWASGHDEKTGVTLWCRDAVYLPPPEMNAMDADAVRAAMKAALAYLHDWLCDFVFARPVDKDIAIAICLTIVARLALGRRIPAFALVSGSGDAAKTRLADLIAVTFTGFFSSANAVDPITTGQSTEERSSLLCDLHRQAESRVVLMDEVPSSARLGSPTLQRVLTTGVVSYYGSRRDFQPVVLMTSTGMQPSAALAKRLLILTLMPQRSGTVHQHPNIERETIANRPHLVRAALTLLAGRERLIALGASAADRGLPCGDWLEWRRLVQGAIIDADGTDVGKAYAETRCEIVADDPDTHLLVELARYAKRAGRSPFTAADVAKDVEQAEPSTDAPVVPTPYPELRGMLRARLKLGDDQRLTSRRVEPLLRRLATRGELGGVRLVRRSFDTHHQPVEYTADGDGEAI